MKQFFGAFFGSIVGIILAALIVLLITVIIVKSAFSMALKEQEQFSTVKPNTVLKIKLNGALIERENENMKLLEGIGAMAGEQHGLHSLVRKISHAATDINIKGIYLQVNEIDAGFASLQELRDALSAFKKSGKFVYAYGENFSAKEYFLASVSDKVYLHPLGMVEWHGLGMNLLFFKQMLEKLDIELQLFRHGKFKSAIEPLMLEKMSEANRLQTRAFLGSIWNSMVSAVSKSRKVPAETLNAMADKLQLGSALDAKGSLVDDVIYEDEVMALLKKKAGIGEKEKLAIVEDTKYEGRAKTDVKSRNNRIAVIYASGQIASGERSEDEIGSERIARALRECRLDDKVKAIVLRVNSPGGSALASDVIWREMELARKAKPLVVSMGDLAASGGYYISCAAHRIFAQPNTITGSIGVFGVIPNLGKLLEKKLGVTTDTVKTNTHGDIASGLRSTDEAEKVYIQNSVEQIYSVFIKHVADGRHLRTADVDSIGQGRVWSGAEAKRIGLVDEEGGLQQAIAYAAKKAGVSGYRLEELPKQKGLFDGLLKMKEEETTKAISSKVPAELFHCYRTLQSLLNGSIVQARLPFEFSIN
jgi:protease-4